MNEDRGRAMGSGGSRRTLAAAFVVVLGMGGLVAVPGERPETGRPPGWVTSLEGARSPAAGPVPWQGSTSAPLATSTPARPGTVEWPRPGRWEVTLGEVDEPVGPVNAAVRVAAAADGVSGRALRVEVLDRAAAARVGVSGFVFTVSPTEPVRGAALPVGLSIDYSRFADAYGAGYGDRLQVVRLPACAVADPLPAGCRAAGARLPVRNDSAGRALAVEVADVGLEPATAFAVTSSPGGETGTFAATPLSVTGSWQVAPGSGGFSYSYPIGVPAPAAGGAPSVGLSYSSASIDGLTLATNPMASPSGLGWSDFANAYIERSYEPCFRAIATTDLCWKSDNATISLAGISGPLLPVNPGRTEWRVVSDPGWRIERLTGAPYTNVYQGQYWRVTGPDGTRYIFGGGHMPGRVTNSILGVPVLADNPGEPCRSASDTLDWCQQGWRWYLDRVEDRDGNVQSLLYEREDNWYSAVNGIGGPGNNLPYHRGALLKEIIYGGRGWDDNAYAARVTFGLEWRCIYLVAACPPPASDNPNGFPDVPVDLICAPGVACSVHAPSFFTARRYSYVRTDVRVGADWKPVAQHNLIHEITNNGPWIIGSRARKLNLTAVQHAAIAFGGLNAYPPTTFGYTFSDNRIDDGGVAERRMSHPRLTFVTNPFGGTTGVVYGSNRPCGSTYNPWPRWDLNVRDCFPQSVKDGDHLRTGVFRKTLVTKVVESPGAGSPAMTTSYTYEGDPAWGFDTGAFARDEDETGWSLWRGYGTTTVKRASARTRVQVFRGWDQDPMLVLDAGGNWVPLGHRNATVAPIDGSPSTVDHHALAGRVLVEQRLGTLDGVADTVVQSRRHEYEKRLTHDPGPDFLFDAEWVGLRSTTERVHSAPGLYRERRSQTSYNPRFQPTTTLEEGWLGVAGDERCSITTYADNTALGMVGYPAVNKKVAGSCGSTQVLSLSETFYDGSTVLGAAPTRGNPTRQRTLIAGSQSSGQYSETAMEFDELGRPVRVTDPTGAVTTTAYTVTAGAPVVQIPIRTTATNALGHQTVTDHQPEFGVPRQVRDANGRATTYRYDEFGRLIAVCLPNTGGCGPLGCTGCAANWRFSYDIANRAVRASQRVDRTTDPAPVYQDTWVVYDGFWRERQVQSLSPESGKMLVAETSYDDRGQVREQTVEQAFPGTPGVYLAVGPAWLNRTRHGYDELGRQVRKEWLRGEAVAHATTTAYGVDTVTVTGPDGRKVREQVDGLGRTIAVGEHDGLGWVTSTYSYDLADRLLSATDPAGNRISYTYALSGWRTSYNDPNRGGALFAYDRAGRQVLAVDALSRQIHTRYDILGRPVERRADAPTGPLLASWTYDTAPGGKGRPHRETTHTTTGAWMTEVLGYDSRGRADGSRLTVPAGIPGLSGQYTVTQTYDRADRVRSVTYPAIGGLPAETVTTDYNNLGLPTRLAGLDEYVWSAAYDDRGRRTSAGLGPRPGGATWMARTWTYNVDQRVNGAETFIAGTGVVSDHELSFDPAGNLTEKLTRQNGLAWRECFGYDPRSRLTAAHTVAAATSCVDGTPGTGDRPYRHGYQYSPDGKLTARTENGTTTAYTYPAAGSPRPHAPTQVGADTYAWDGNGRLAARTVAGRAETLTWAIDGTLASMTGPNGQTTTLVHDAAGQRLLRRTPDGRATLYVAGHEITANSTGTIVTAVRPYTFDGLLVATRSLTGVEYLVSDPAGSVEMAVPAGGSPTATRAYAPYGKVRAQHGDTATDRGFVGQIEDTSTGLSYLNARYYDTTIGVFISTDPVHDTTNVKSFNPYSYAASNPTTFADPGGRYSMYAFGLEVENSRLRAQNKQLIGHIEALGQHIETLQDIIRKQHDQLTELLTYVEALEAEIIRQASIIEQLVERVRYLEGVVAAQRREISRLRGIIAYQQGVIRGLVNLAYLPEFRSQVLSSIAAGRGLPDLWYGTYQAQAIMLAAQLSSLQAAPQGAVAARANARGDALAARAQDVKATSAQVTLGDQRDRIRELQAQVDQLTGTVQQLAGAVAPPPSDDFSYAEWDAEVALLIAAENPVVGSVTFVNDARQLYQEHPWLPDPGGIVTCMGLPMIFDSDCH